jgi:beta-N-acetylhexosaminidase
MKLVGQNGNLKSYGLKVTILGTLAVLLLSFYVSRRVEMVPDSLYAELPIRWYSQELKKINELPDYEQYQQYEKNIVVLKNELEFLPFNQAKRGTAIVNLGKGSPLPFLEMTGNFGSFKTLNALIFKKNELTSDEILNWIKNNDINQIIVSIHADGIKNEFSDVDTGLFDKLPEQYKIVLCVFGNENILKSINTQKIDAIVLGLENHPIAQDRVAQLLFGAMPLRGETNHAIESKDEQFSSGTKFEQKSFGILKFSLPEELGIESSKLVEIDHIVENGIKKGAFPGCQIVVAVEGNIIYRKSFGTHTYEDHDTVVNDDVYDIASVSKIAGSTIGLMKLQSEGKVDISKQLGDYLTELTQNTEYKSIVIREMMAHQAGLTPWIPFYKRTLKNGELNENIYCLHKKNGFTCQVAQNLWINDSYSDSIYKQILATPLGEKKYVYSDLGYYFIKKIIEKQSGQKLDDFLMNEFYVPMGLRYMRFNPSVYFPLAKIIPTEDDRAFRKQLVHGFVHDPGAAMLGGVGGHAGIFSNATDLASIMQMLLNKGFYGNNRYLSESVVDAFTSAQFPGNRRGVGFDRPVSNGGGPCHESASQLSFGHSGFTGTFVWSDPKYGINYVFLSNRVCPNQDNWKIRDMNIRTHIQGVIYDAVLNRKK